MKKYYFFLAFLFGFSILQAQENITDKFSDQFLTENLKSFDAPAWDFLDQNPLKKITDTTLLSELSEATGFDREWADFYFYTIEDHIEDVDEFTVFCYAQEEGNYIFYVVCYNGRIDDAVKIAWDFAMGEYSESAYGTFLEEDLYELTVDGFAEPYEEEDGISEGEQFLNIFHLHFYGDGFIESEELGD